MDRPAFSYRFGSAEFDESRFELRVAGLPVEVERRALEVLAYLLRHAGEAVTKDELLREVWSGRITVDKVLPNAITKLRRALGEANAEHVTTLARVGYRLEGPISRIAVGRQLVSELQLVVGHAVPSRPNFVLRRQLARTAGSEVWLAEHGKTREQRVYKFGLDHDRLRALKREATLLRVLQESLADCSHFVDIIDWNFESPPYFLECGYGGDNLAEWATSHLEPLTDSARVSVFLQIADAVTAAHSVGVLHKDLKHANVLISTSGDQLHIRLTDFGSGRLLDPEHLAKLGITRLSLTMTESVVTDATSGTPLYVAPEVFAGQTPTVQSDVFALGVLLYQLLSGRIGQPMVSGWEQNIGDPLLQEDVRLATDGNPERRLASAADLAARLRRLGARREEDARRTQAEIEAEQIRTALTRSQARRPMALALIAVLVIGITVAIALQQIAVRARNEARDELARATAITRFVNEDLIGRSNPLVSAKGADATLKEVLLAARSRVAARFAQQPGAEAAIRLSLANLFHTIDLWQDADIEARLALDLYAREQGPDHIESLRARSLLVSVQSRLGQTAEAEKTLTELVRLTADDNSDTASYLRASAASTLAISRGDYAGAAKQLDIAVTALAVSEPDNTALLDNLRINLIACVALAGDVEASKAAAQSLIRDAKARKDDATLTVALAKLAVVRAHGEDHAAVEQLLREAQPVIVERLGENHSRHLQLLGELLGLALRRGDFENGVRYAEQVYLRVRAKMGDAHPTTFVTLTNWGRLLHEAGQPAAAALRLREAHARLLGIAGTASAQTQDAGLLLAAVELELGNVDAAVALTSSLNADTLETGRATGMWSAMLDALRGIALQQQGDTESARPLLTSALQALASEEDLDAPGRLYVQTREALAKLP